MNWYKNKGNEGDIVLSTRVRLARNMTEYPFPARLDETQKKDIGTIIKLGRSLYCIVRVLQILSNRATFM